jgi:hypothetical protein
MQHQFPKLPSSDGSFPRPRKSATNGPIWLATYESDLVELYNLTADIIEKEIRYQIDWKSPENMNRFSQFIYDTSSGKLL